MIVSWRTSILATVSVVLTLPLLAACTDNTPAGSADSVSADLRALTVTATDTTCEVSTNTAPSGNLRFSVTNSGSKVNEVCRQSAGEHQDLV